MKKPRIMEYEAPVYDEMSVSPQSVICGSETGKVSETLGEW